MFFEILNKLCRYNMLYLNLTIKGTLINNSLRLKTNLIDEKHGWLVVCKIKTLNYQVQLKK